MFCLSAQGLCSHEHSGFQDPLTFLSGLQLLLGCTPSWPKPSSPHLSTPVSSRRNGKDVGRSVSAWGYWGDILNSPYHCFGTVAEEDGFFKVSNKQFCRTAVDVAEHNIMVGEGPGGPCF